MRNKIKFILVIFYKRMQKNISLRFVQAFNEKHALYTSLFRRPSINKVSIYSNPKATVKWVEENTNHDARRVVYRKPAMDKE